MFKKSFREIQLKENRLTDFRSTDVNVSRFAPAITFLAERIAEQNRIRRMNRSEEKDEDEDDSPEPAPSDAASSP